MPKVSREVRDRARVRLTLLLLQTLVAFGLRGFYILDLHPPEKPSTLSLGPGPRGPRILPHGWDLIVTEGQVCTG